MNEFGLALLWCACQVTLLGIFAGLLYLFIKPFGPVARALVASSSLIVVAILSAFTLSPWPNWQNLNFAVVTDEAVTENTTPEVVNSPLLATESKPETDAEKPDADITNSQSVALDLPAFHAVQDFWESFQEEFRDSAATVELENQWQRSEILAVLFSIAIALGLVRLIIGWFTVRQYYRHGTVINEDRLSELVDLIRAELGCRRTIQLRESKSLVTAATLGWRRPSVLLPGGWRDWSDQELRAVLAHELAHIQSNDFLSNLFAQLSLSLHYYHPLVHWLVGRMRLEQELVADAQAARLAGGNKNYLTTLAELALKQTDRPLGWPARSFLPTRRNFMRRIEMLRDSQKLSFSFTLPIRLLTVSIVVATGILVSGFRNPVVSTEPQVLAAETKKPSSESEVKQVKFSLEYIPNKDLLLVISARPAEFFGNDKMKPLAQLVNTNLHEHLDLNIPTEQLIHFEELTYILHSPDEGLPARRIILRSKNEIDMAKLDPDAGSHFVKKKFEDQDYYLIPTQEGPAYFFPDPKTLVFESEVSHLKSLLASHRSKQPLVPWKKRWNDLPGSEIKIAMNVTNAATKIGYTPPEAKRDTTLLTLFGPAIEESQILVAGASVSKEINLNLIADYASTQRTNRAKETLVALKTIAKNLLVTTRREIAKDPNRDAQSAAKMKVANIADELLDNLQIEQKQTQLHLTSKSNYNIAAFLNPALQTSKTKTGINPNRQNMNRKHNLWRISYAMHAFWDKHHALPLPVDYRDRAGEVPVSWRVLLLSFLGHGALYNQYRMKEPWDSPHNRKLLAKMPEVYRHPSENRYTTNTSYFVLVGSNTMFPKVHNYHRGISLAEVEDGASLTIMVVEAKRKIPWTKPEDLPYDESKPLPKIDGYQKNAFTVAFGDGSIHEISQTLDEKKLRAMISRAGSELVYKKKWLNINN